MRLLMALLLALTTVPMATAQVSSDEALNRLRERQRQREVAASQPATRPADADAAARQAIQETADHIDKALAAVRFSDAAVDACLNRIRDQSFRIYGRVVSVESDAPGLDGKRAVLVRLVLDRNRNADRLWDRERFQTQMRCVERQRLLTSESKLNIYNEDRTFQRSFKRQMKQTQEECDAALRKLNMTKPDRLTADLHLVAPDALLETLKPDQPLRGTVTFTRAQVRIGEWRPGDQSLIRYLDKITVFGALTPDR